MTFIYAVYSAKHNQVWTQTLCREHAEREMLEGYTVTPVGTSQEMCHDCREESEYEDYLRLCDSYDRVGETPRSY